MSKSVAASFGAHDFDLVDATWLEVATSKRIVDISVDDINAATYRYALRMLGIRDELDRVGQLTCMQLPEELRVPVLPAA
ncbi:MAG: hypothetical protein ABJ360_04635 [Roseobacter sp.]